MEIICYAQRLFNPFRGIMNIVAYGGAEAVSLDGVEWDIYVRDTELVEDLQNSRHILSTEVRYGHWSVQKGLVRGSIYPSDDFKRMEAQGHVVLAYLQQHHQDVPFTLQDTYELWLLDIMRQPLAILNSVVNADEIELDDSILWRAGIKCEEDFCSPHFNNLNKPQYKAGEYISYYINECAQPEPCAQWFHRQNDGTGIGLQGIGLHHQYRTRQLANKVFPKYFVNDLSHDAQHSQLLENYLIWQAPYFLLLQNLSKHRRIIIEQQACKRAVLVDELCHLYPQVLDQKVINAARVEAVLRRNQTLSKELKKDDEYCPDWQIP